MADVIKEKKILAVEGRDEKEFFDALLKHLKVKGYEIHEVGGKDQFKDKMPALVRASGFSEVEVLAVIRDANGDAKATFQSITNVLKKLEVEEKNLTTPSKPNQFSTGNPQIGIYVMPGDSPKGMLEDLCLKTVAKHPAMKCVNEFLDCVGKLKSKPKNLSKAKAQAFLAAMPKIVNSVGLGAKKKYWNFDSTELNKLKSFLSNLR